MLMMFVGGLCPWSTEFPYYSYSRKPTGREIFVPARTLIAVFLLSIKNGRATPKRSKPKPLHYDVFEALDPHRMDVTSMWDIYEVFAIVNRHLDPSSHCYYHICCGLDYGKSAKLPEQCQALTMPLCNGWGFRQTQNGCHTHVRHIYSVFCSMMWIGIRIHHYTPNITFLDLNFGKLAKILEQGRGMNHAIMQWLKIDQLLRMDVTSTQ
jgi:hypothetical protein